MKFATFFLMAMLLLMLTVYFTLEATCEDFQQDFHVTYGSPADPNVALVASNCTGQDFLNTTNPYVQNQLETANEIVESETSRPLYVLVFGDEEERGLTRVVWWSYRPPSVYDWESWANVQIERGEVALRSNFGIDIRILGFEEWDSDNSKTSMYDLWNELLAEKGNYIGKWYNGEYWSNYVDAIIGITYQATPADSPPILGLTAGPLCLDQKKNVILIKWHNTWWGDDNLIQHELSHLFYADDHYSGCCVMASHTHYQTWIWEDDLWWVFSDVPCSLTSYSWCSYCSGIIQTYENLYDESHTLVVRHGPLVYPYVYYGTISIPYTTYSGITQITISVASVKSGYAFDYWLINGTQKVYTTSITITISGKTTIAAYFKKASIPRPSPPRRGGGGPGRWIMCK